MTKRLTFLFCLFFLVVCVGAVTPVMPASLGFERIPGQTVPLTALPHNIATDSPSVIPAKAGIQETSLEAGACPGLRSGVHRCDDSGPTTTDSFCGALVMAGVPAYPDKVAALPSLARQFALGVKRIVIDPGHGGKDCGAMSCNRVPEKDITLDIAKALKQVLETRTGCKAILTRTRDQFLTLEERTRIANEAKADLFISIHANAHMDASLSGVETYSLNFAKDQESARVAALENRPSNKSMNDLKALLNKLLATTKVNESAALARQVHRNIIAKIKAKGDKVRDLGVKQAPFRVLLGAEMPSILIETGFVTNRIDENRLKSRAFQQDLAKGIAAGIESYITEVKKVAKAGERP